MTVKSLMLSMFLLSSLAGCASGVAEGSLADRLISGGATLPPLAAQDFGDVYCPEVGVTEGGAALQGYAGNRVGDAGGLRTQISLGQLVRECVGQADGSVIVKIGIQGRVLLGAAGSSGRYDVPLHVVVKRGSRILADRGLKTTVNIPAGETQGTFAIVQENLLVPPSEASTFEIEVGLGNSSVNRSKPSRG